MVRVPDVDRLETRLPDGSANPYLLQASIIAAGLGDTLFDINKANNRNEKTPREPGVLPRHLGEAIGRFEQSQLVDRAFHKEARDAILSLKKAEWGEYLDQITSWESKTYLDCQGRPLVIRFAYTMATPETKLALEAYFQCMAQKINTDR